MVVLKPRNDWTGGGSLLLIKRNGIVTVCGSPTIYDTFGIATKPNLTRKFYNRGAKIFSSTIF